MIGLRLLSLATLAGLTLLACGGARPVSVVRMPAPSFDAHEHDSEPTEPGPSDEPVASAAPTTAPDKTPLSTATYEQAVSKPEPIDINDDRIHLSDVQLNAPMRGVVSGCRMPGNAHVTIKTAVQAGRAIGVTVKVRFDHPRSRRPLPLATLRAEAKMSTKIGACIDHAVRVQTWPPSTRRDSFVTEF